MGIYDASSMTAADMRKLANLAHEQLKIEDAAIAAANAKDALAATRANTKAALAFAARAFTNRAPTAEAKGVFDMTEEELGIQDARDAAANASKASVAFETDDNKSGQVGFVVLCTKHRAQLVATRCGIELSRSFERNARTTYLEHASPNPRGPLIVPDTMPALPLARTYCHAPAIQIQPVVQPLCRGVSAADAAKSKAAKSSRRYLRQKPSCTVVSPRQDAQLSRVTRLTKVVFIRCQPRHIAVVSFAGLMFTRGGAIGRVCLSRFSIKVNSLLVVRCHTIPLEVNDTFFVRLFNTPEEGHCCLSSPGEEYPLMV